MESGEIEDVPVETTARLLLGALSAAASTIAGADDPKKAGAEVSTTIVKILQGLRVSAPDGEGDAGR